ncbi:hypothetical protein KUTeg_000007 [Tegillarca granosa]|uniref:Uncharacterized protein n=1 Tax=Tegillarca granosa TaxID=220873 RepID=A0ABQ9FYW2_TEGGR|nr:hypothetical protein KUTeg_000007 [Tegillarca granosa]
MYKRNHLFTLKGAMKKLCLSDKGEKYGLKCIQEKHKNFIWLLCRIIFWFQGEENKKLKEAYNFNLPEIVSKARYHTEKNIR